MVIANGNNPGNLYDILEGKTVGTTFSARNVYERQSLEAAKSARKREVAGLTTEQKNAALNAMADALIAGQDDDP